VGLGAAPWSLQRRAARWCIVAAAVFATACGSTSTETVTSPTPVKCEVSLAPTDHTMDALGGVDKVSVTTAPECAWTAAADASWISSLAPTNGQGSGDVQFTVPPNPD